MPLLVYFGRVVCLLNAMLLVLVLVLELVFVLFDLLTLGTE